MADSKLKLEFTQVPAKFDYALPRLTQKTLLRRKEELVMTQFMKLLLACTMTGIAMITAAIGTAAAAGPENRITILYDAFGKDASMRKDWGFSALVEIAGKRILFDTGDNSDVFAANVKAKNVDLTNLHADMSVIVPPRTPHGYKNTG